MLRLISVLVLSLFAGCAAMITKAGPEEPEISVGTTEAQLIQRLGAPIRSAELTPPRQALALWETDHEVSLLLPKEIARSASFFQFKGRLDKSARAAQAGFDSFMTLGIAEIYLIPKALWERITDEELQLTVWFAADRRALAYKWESPPRVHLGP